MIEDFLPFFEADGEMARLEGGCLMLGQAKIPIRRGIARFTSDRPSSTAGFSLLRERHATLQLDSKNDTTDRRDTILSRTGWLPDFLFGKTLLECGCGVGPDTEVLLRLGAKVLAVDMTGLDVASRNLGKHKDLCLIQADIGDLPLRRQAFDIVFCHRVIQHTANPVQVLDHILQFVKPGGAAFVHSYSRDFHQLFRWKYLFRPATKRMDPERLYRFIEGVAPFLYRLTSFSGRNALGRRFNWIFVPFLNYNRKAKFAAWPDEALIEFGIHDTFDALGPAYDRPLSSGQMNAIAARHLEQPFEVVQGSAFTLLRTVPAG